MNLLAIDTSTDRAAVALAAGDQPPLVADSQSAQRHGRYLIPGISALLRQAHLRVYDLDAIAVGLGPGSYTGLRIGITAAKTLAYAADKPLITFDSLEAIARNAPPDAVRVSVLADAQRGDVYVADFHRPALSSPLIRLSPTRVESLAQWASSVTEPTLALGPYVSRIRETLPPLVSIAEADAHWPLGAHVLDSAREAFASGARVDPWFLEPLYLRRSAAEDQWDALKASG